MDAATAVKLILLAVGPTLLGAAALKAPGWVAAAGRAWSRRRQPEQESRTAGQPEYADLQPIGLPIEQLAADLRRLLRLHVELMASAHLAMRAHRLWAVEAAIGVRAIEAARALGVPHREPAVPGGLDRTELYLLLRGLAEAGLVLPAKVGPFTRYGPG